MCIVTSTHNPNQMEQYPLVHSAEGTAKRWWWVWWESRNWVNCQEILKCRWCNDLCPRWTLLLVGGCPCHCPSSGHLSVWHCMAQGSVAGGESCACLEPVPASVSRSRSSLPPSLCSLLAPHPCQRSCASPERHGDACSSAVCFAGVWELDLWDDCFHRAGVHRHSQG